MSFEQNEIKRLEEILGNSQLSGGATLGETMFELGRRSAVESANKRSNVLAAKIDLYSRRMRVWKMATLVMAAGGLVMFYVSVRNSARQETQVVNHAKQAAEHPERRTPDLSFERSLAQNGAEKTTPGTTIGFHNRIHGNSKRMVDRHSKLGQLFGVSDRQVWPSSELGQGRMRGRRGEFGPEKV